MKQDIGDLSYLIESFEETYGLKEIILLGKDEGIRRIKLDDKKENE